MKNIFLTGDVGVGKTTVLRKVINRTDGFYGGYLGYSNENDGYKDIFIKSLDNLSREYNLARIDHKRGKAVYINKNIFDEVLADEIENSLRNRDIIVLDEIGRFEENSVKFKDSINKALSSDKLVLGVLKKHDGSFINSMKERTDILVIEVTEDNRDNLHLEILEKISKLGYRTNTKSYFSWNNFRIEMYDKCIDRKECEYPGIFMDKILDELKGEVSGKSVLDIGVGTGAFFIEFLRRGSICTGVDISLNMLEYLNKKIKCEKNAKTFFTSFENYKNGKHDIVISAFAAGVSKSEDLIRKAYGKAKEYVFIIYHHPEDYEKFMAVELSEYMGRNLVPEKKKRPKEDIMFKLEEMGIEYEHEVVEFDFPQYLKDIDEGVKLFQTFFDIKEDEKDKLKSFLESKAIKTDSDYMLPEKRKSIFLKIKK